MGTMGHSKTAKATAKLLAAMLGLGTAAAFAQSYPAKPVRVINSTAAGGVIDLTVRALGQAFAERTGQNFVVENRIGANAIIPSEACAKAAPDGYTICVLPKTAISLNPSLYSKLPYDPAKFEAISELVVSQEVLVINPSIPAHGLKELIDYSRANPDKINYASSGVGSNVHLTMERLKLRTGASLTHIPYKGASEAPQAFLSGAVQLMYLIIGNPGVVEQIKAGQSRAVVVSGDARSPLLPNVPTFTEAGYPNIESPNWFGMFGPAGMPKDIVSKLSAELSAIVRSAAFKDKILTPRGFQAVGSSAEEFARFLVEDRKRGIELVKISGARLD